MSWTSTIDRRLGSLRLRLIYQKDLTLQYLRIGDNLPVQPNRYTPGYTDNRIVLLSWRAEARQETTRFIRVETASPLAEAYENFIYENNKSDLLPYVVSLGSERALVLYSRQYDRASPFPYREYPELAQFVRAEESKIYIAPIEIQVKIAQWLIASLHAYCSSINDEEAESFGLDFGLWGDWYHDAQKLTVRG